VARPGLIRPDPRQPSRLAFWFPDGRVSPAGLEHPPCAALRGAGPAQRAPCGAGAGVRRPSRSASSRSVSHSAHGV